MTQQQFTDKLKLMEIAAIMANGICPPGTAEATYNTEHARAYQFLLMRAMPDETVYTTPAANDQAPGGTIPQGALLAAISKALSDPAQAGNLAASITKMIATVVPGAAPVAAATSALAAAVNALPTVAPAKTTP